MIQTMTLLFLSSGLSILAYQLEPPLRITLWLVIGVAVGAIALRWRHPASVALGVGAGIPVVFVGAVVGSGATLTLDVIAYHMAALGVFSMLFTGIAWATRWATRRRSDAGRMDGASRESR